MPGLLDGHVHVESGMLTVSEFVRAVIPHGTTGIFIDPHEIANVFGLKGVRMMVDEAAEQPIHVWVQVPSCVPSAPGLETPGIAFGSDEIEEALAWPGVIGLGEVMNSSAVILSDANIHAELEATRRAHKVIGGHYASADLGLPFHGYAASGVEDDHEGTRAEDAVARARQGMKVMLRYGSAWQDVAQQIKAITEQRLDSRHFILCTDDSHSETLANQGHMDRVIKHAISQGIPPIIALQMATLNTAEHFGLDKDIGQIAPGRQADILLVDDLVAMNIQMVIVKGRVLAENGRLLAEIPLFDHPDWSKHSVNLPVPVRPEAFRLIPPHNGQVKANVIGIIENKAPTRHLQVTLPVEDGLVVIDQGQDIAKVGLVERHQGKGVVQIGLVRGFGFTEPCAVASTVAHDSHQLLVVGTEDASMAVATNALSACGGGQVVVRRGEVIGLVDLPIAGLMSDQSAEIVARKVATVLDGFKACGCTLNSPNMQLSLLALVVIPALRISDKGLVDVNNLRFIRVLE